jgi:hypothetical protein
MQLEEALALIDNVLSRYQGTRADHELILKAVAVVRAALAAGAAE